MGMFLNKDAAGGWKTVSAAYINVSSVGWKKIVQGWINISGSGWKKFIGGTATGKPVGSGIPTIERTDTTTYKWSVNTQGTWTQSPTDYRYQWQRAVSTAPTTWYDISGATADNYDYSSYKLQYVRLQVWASNEFGESTTFLTSASSVNYYTNPTASLTATGGAGKITITPTWGGDDSGVTAVVKVGTTTVTNSGSGTAFDYSVAAAGTYTVTLTATNSSGNGNSYSTTVTKDATATAPPLYTVSFDKNGGGGTAPSAITQSTSGGSITLPGVGSMTAPSGKPVFSGWVAVSTDTTALTSPYTPSANITLYALWKAATTYTVTFKANGGTGADYTQSASTTTALTANTFTKADTFVTPQWTGSLPSWNSGTNFERGSNYIRYGWNNGSQSWTGTINDYSFAGWNTSANGSGTAYAGGANYAFNADLTLYAQWTVSRRSRGFNWQLRSSTSTTNTTNITDSGYKVYSTTNDTRATVQLANFIYLLRSDGTAGQRDIVYSANPRYGRVQVYQFGTDGNEYNSGWTGFI